METLKVFNGNNQEMTKTLPRLFMLGYCNPTALEHIRNNTGLDFKECAGGFEAFPSSSNQIVRLFLTYNFKTRYYDNWSEKNTIMLKSDHHTGFDVDAICYECVKHNHIHTNGLKEGDYLSC